MAEMNLITGRIRVPLWILFVCLLLTLTIASLLWYYSIEDNDVKLVGLVGGIVSGLVVSILTFALSIGPLQKLDQFEQMGIRQLLANRHEKEYYRRVVAGAEEIVCVMGSSCSRFVEDFLDMQSDDKVLVDALRKNRDLKIRLLVPEEQYMSPDARARAPIVRRKLAALRDEFEDRIELRFFPCPAHHAFVICDSDLLAGPIFESDQSRYAPAVHVSASTPFARKYREHFEHVWDASEPRR